ncbi:cold and drought-regulated protein CORA [Manihot esculenta]|uniref:Glycine rich protein n=1 Tax=Manihot esculenta TaxID=3983 RepID=A0A2C9UDE6_MANES|nr:cold and drought-regulated protein CORA [Manihot esculenta]OAY28420.1 hypothetical protein MANES_15G065100v8 [Manihot esculenta]
MASSKTFLLFIGVAFAVLFLISYQVSAHESVGTVETQESATADVNSFQPEKGHGYGYGRGYGGYGRYGHGYGGYGHGHGHGHGGYGRGYGGYGRGYGYGGKHGYGDGYGYGGYGKHGFGGKPKAMGEAEAEN